VEINLLDYQNRFDASKRYFKHLFRSEKGIQAAEYNEVQDAIHLRLKSIADTLYSDGDIVEGCEIGVDTAGGIIKLGAGHVYVDGEVHSIGAATIPLPPDESVVAGIWYTERIVTEIEDGTLRDPAVGSANYMQPGAARLQIATFWGLADETHANGRFYTLHIVSNGEVVKIAQTETPNQVSDIVERYDNDSNGSYVVDGMSVRVLPDSEAGKQTYSVAEGKAHVEGKEVLRPYAQRLIVGENPDIRDIISEEHIFNPGQNGAMRINLRHIPVSEVTSIRGTKQKTATLTHGSFTGASDPLPDEAAIALVEVRQGETVYEYGTDFTLQNDRVNWSPSGAEPAPGSTYTVTYHYRTVIAAESPDTEGFTVSNLVSGQLVTVDYSYMLPRVDIVVLDKHGEVYIVRGVSHRYAAVAPPAPTGTLKLAAIVQSWSGLPAVTNDSVRVTSMKDLDAVKKAIIDIYDLTAQNRMMNEAMLNAPTSARGMFVDPFTGDDRRDAGIEQSAAVVAGTLMLPIDANITQTRDGIVDTLDFDVEPILEQPARTGSMKINPYQAQEPMPAAVKLDPEVDRWSNVVSQFTSSETQRFTQTHGGSFAAYTTTTTTVQTIGSSAAEDAFMRERSVGVKADGFGANEHFTVIFDGLLVRQGDADAQGRIETSFDVPPGIPVGTKQVVVSGSGGSRGEAAYTATGTTTTQIQRNIVRIVTHVDPVAQTFTPDASRYATGVELYFTVKGTSEVRVQIRDVQLGFPAKSVLAEGRIKAADIVAGTVNRIMFDWPVLLMAGTEYALTVLCDTSDHEIAVAELGKWDAAGNKWLTSQAYQAGVLLSSSNASTWTPHQTMDMWFRLLGAKFTAGKKLVPLGEVNLTDTTDLLPLAEVEFAAPSAEATFVLKKAGVEAARVQPGQTLSLTDKYQGLHELFAELSGSADFSPVLYGGMQLVAGKQRDTADYVSRAFPCGAGRRVLATLEAIQPGSSAVQVRIQTGANTWADAEPYGTAANLGDGWQELSFEAMCDAPETRVKIILTGSAADRPRARSLRAVVMDA
jgi:hypothetical protein